MTVISKLFSKTAEFLQNMQENILWQSFSIDFLHSIFKIINMKSIIQAPLQKKSPLNKDLFCLEILLQQRSNLTGHQAIL